jgi:hypothetical protein
MNITISRNGQQFGPYTLEQAQAYVASGQLLLTDMAFVEGTTVWVQLRVVLGVCPRTWTLDVFENWVGSEEFDCQSGVDGGRRAKWQWA